MKDARAWMRWLTSEDWLDKALLLQNNRPKRRRLSLDDRGIDVTPALAPARSQGRAFIILDHKPV